jgi:hypothetical protein
MQKSKQSHSCSQIIILVAKVIYYFNLLVQCFIEIDLFSEQKCEWFLDEVIFKLVARDKRTRAENDIFYFTFMTQKLIARDRCCSHKKH